MKFIHAIIFTPGESIPADWADMRFGDYVVHALYSVETDIKAFLFGIYFATNQKPQVTKCYVIADDPYSETEVTKKLKNLDFMEVI